MADRSIAPISKSTRVTRDGLISIINDAIAQVNEFYSLYDRYFTAEDGGSTYLQQVEAKIEALSDAYKNLFGTSPTKIEEIDKAVAAIKDYHTKLLGDEGSIKADIDDSQTAIRKFYNTLFSSSDGVNKDGGQEVVVNAAVKSITDFDLLLNTATTGYKDTVETAKQEILAAHSSLFNKEKKSNKSKVELLDEQIAKTHEYFTETKDEILPYIKKRQTELDEVTSDIHTKRSEIDSLLSKATVRTLAKGYTEAMQIYGNPVLGDFPRKGKVKKIWFVIRGLATLSKHFLKFIGSYALFIGPLVAIGVLFVTNSNSIFGVDLTGKVTFSGTEYIFYKLTIALPLLWVSWFGQRSIAHRKRLFEEYNHKLRVVQMYMLFAAKENTYALKDTTRKKLETTLLDTIGRNPSEVYGKDETMIDKIIEVFGHKGNKASYPKADQTAPSE